MSLTVDKTHRFMFTVNGRELVATEQKITAHEILEQAEKEGTITGNPQDYELKSVAHDDHVYDWNYDVDLSIDNHFITSPVPGTPYPRSDFKIFVNGREQIVDSSEVTFHQVVTLAFDRPPSGPYIEFRVTYRDAAGPRRDGYLREGQSIQVHDGTVFNVTATDKS